MADNPSQSSEQSSRDGEAGERSEEQTNEQTGGETATNERQKAKKSKTHNAGAAQTEENAGEEEAEEQNEEETKPGEKPHIPDDFYYEVEELWRKPRKSDETLPDDLVTLYHSFGYPCRMRNNLHAIGADRLIFAAGGYLQIVVMDDSGYKYDYLPTTGGGSVGALAVHPQGKLFAVGEKGPTPVVNIFTVAEYKLYRILRAGTTVSFTAVAFNEQGDLLASQGGEPDYMLTVWNWQQESILLRCKSFSQEVNHVSFNRDLQGALTSAGIGHIKFWNMARTFTGLKLQGLVGRFGRTTLSDIEGYIEFPDGKVLSGSDWGNMLLWDENLIKLQIGRKNGKFCHAGKIMHMMIVEGEIISAGMDGFVRSWNLELIDMLEAGEESGLVEIEAMNEVLIGAGAQLYYLTQPRSKKEIAKKGVEESEIGDSAESSDEHSGSSTWYCQDGAGGIWKADLSFRNAAAPSKRILHFHAGAIVACAVSPVTHLVMTLGEDGTLRLYDFLTKKLLTVRQFKAQGSSLVWIPLSVDNKCATVMAGFADGGIRRVAIDGSTSTVFGKDRMECQLKLMQALKPHDQPVTCLAYSIKSATDGMSFLVTCSVDKTVFFFDVLGEKYVPLCFVTVLHVPRHAYCSPDQATQGYVMVTCDDGFVIEMIHPVIVDQTETLQYDKVKMRSYQFASVKSKILHDEELAKADEIEQKRLEERDEDNKMLLVKGVETPSQQELRVTAEDENAAMEKIAKEESEDPWKPYIPPVPSPILQTVYLEGDSKFWLMLGEYDAGFMYECQFNQKFEKRGDEPRPEQSGKNSDEKNDEKSADKFAEKTPLRTIRVVDAENNPITAMCFNSDGTCVFFGMQDGRIRLQFLESEFDLATERFHWSIGAHDVTHGPITGMKLSHDESFLITVGEDGIFFIFNLVPIEQLMDDMAAKGAKIPACAADEKDKADLTANQYTIEQAKQKSDYDRMLMVAERHKQDRRAEVASLGMTFKRLVAKNVALPLRHRLTPDEFVMDESRVQELKEENMLKVKDIRCQTAWDCEKARLSYEKMKTYYMEHLETHRFCVKAINTDHVIYSYRAVVKPIVTMSPRHSKMSLTERGSADDDKATSDDEDALELKRLMGTPITSETLLGLSTRTAFLLKKVEEKRLNRAKRKMAWTHFFNTKPGDDFEDPADVAAIQEAYDTMGDRHLKSDSKYIVPDSYRLTLADGSARLEGCEQRLLTAQRELNAKLLELREEKINTIHEVQGMVDRLFEIHEALDHTKHQLIPSVPDLTLSEVPGGKFNMDRSDETRLRMKVREEMRKRRGSVNLNQATSRRESIFSKSQRKSSVAIAKENFTRLKAMAHIDIDLSESVPSGSYAFHPGLDELKEKEEMELTAMQRELREIHEIELIYEQSQLIKHIQETKQIFDIHHRQLRHEKFLLDVVVEFCRLKVITLQEEQLLLRDCEHVEEEIHGRIEGCLEQRVDIDKSVKSLQGQLVKQGRELEELAKKEKVLYQKLEAIMGEAHNFHDYLVKVYKKKVKRKVARTLTNDDEESSESESDSSDESEVEEDDEDAVHHDLNMCPVGCDQNNYNDVVALREHRLDLDEVVTEVKRLRDGVLKELDNCVKKRQSTEVTYTKALQEFTAFQLEKQKRVNNLDVLCTIQLHQIQCVGRDGEFRSITDELLIDKTEVIRLQKRISELKVEKNEQKKMTIQRRKLHVHLQYERRHFLNRLEKMNQLTEKEMRSKFGKVVDLEEVETVAAVVHVEDVRSRLLRYQIGCDKELLQKKNQLKCLRKNNSGSLRINSEYKHLEAALKARHLVLEHDLNEVAKKHNMAYEEDPPEISKEMEEMMDVVATQRGAIKALTLEIEYLQGREQPPIFGHHSGSYA
ncbi:cilia- and flagella-associated protein 44-like isoform X3 [Littorina saxatilis]|uniref:cilia- and flagella-associated protein 44-like isoform X3 n=1 Tax=Littorina saxatilis TaxID=31220 RepID=UPI0038B524BD